MNSCFRGKIILRNNHVNNETIHKTIQQELLQICRVYQIHAQKATTCKEILKNLFTRRNPAWSAQEKKSALHTLKCKNYNFHRRTLAKWSIFLLKFWFFWQNLFFSEKILAWKDVLSIFFIIASFLLIDLISPTLIFVIFSRTCHICHFRRRLDRPYDRLF